MLNCIDNSGAAIVECVKVLKMKRAAKVGACPRLFFFLIARCNGANCSSAGDRIVVVVQKQRNLGSELSGSAAAAQKVRRGDISHAVVVRTKKKYGRPDGSFVRFDDNACVLINKAGDPMGTRLNGIGVTIIGAVA
jgi:large subunit ribosomal protein L14